MSIAGTWNLVMMTPIGERKAKLAITEAGGALSGSLTNDEGGRTEIRNATVSSGLYTFSADVKSPMPLTLDFNATVHGNEITGNVSAGGIGSWGFRGTRA